MNIKNISKPKLLIIFTAVVILGIPVVLITMAGRTEPIKIVSGPYRQYQDPIEQQTQGGATQPDRSLWVTNPTQCVWDLDDIFKVSAYGALKPNESYTVESCINADWGTHLVKFGASGNPKKNLPVEMTVAFSPGYTKTLRGGVVSGCAVATNYDRTFSGLQTIAGSNGGKAVPTKVTVTVKNLSSRTTISGAQVWLDMQLNTSDAQANCPVTPINTKGLKEGSPFSLGGLITWSLPSTQ